MAMVLCWRPCILVFGRASKLAFVLRGMDAYGNAHGRNHESGNPGHRLLCPDIAAGDHNAHVRA